MAGTFQRQGAPTMRKRRRRLLGLLMIPIGLFAWCIGWSLFWMGKTKKKLKPLQAEHGGNLTFSVLLPEPKLELRNRGYTAEASEKERQD